MSGNRSRVKWLVLVILVVIVGSVFLVACSSEKVDFEDIVIEDIDFTQVPDGIYPGEAKNGLIEAEVMVEVKNGDVISIELLRHKTTKGGPAEVITDDVVEAQSLQVDAISAATKSSKIILLAVQNALSNALLNE